MASQTCSISNGSLTGAFIVANLPGAQYSVTATGAQAADSASAVFAVNRFPLRSCLIHLLLWLEEPFKCPVPVFWQVTMPAHSLAVV